MAKLFDHPGIAPIRHLLLDDQVNEIMINGKAQVYVERAGSMQLDPFQLENTRQLEFLIEALLRPSNRTVDAMNPYVDSRLPDGSRVNVIIPPLAIDGAVVTIRKFTRSLNTVADLIEVGAMSDRMARLLYAAILGKLNVVFAGATGTGKTTTLNILASYIPKHERVVTIEDTAELDLDLDHVVRLECRPANVEGEGAVGLGDLLKNALRMRPSRIIVGEVRGDEAVDMLAAISSGHEGCLAVLHASSPRDALSRLEMMVLQRGLNLPLWAIHKQISNAIDLLVQHEFLPDGSRKITRITEVCSKEIDFGDGGPAGSLPEESSIQLRDLFEYRTEDKSPEGKTIGNWHCTGHEPTFLPKLEARQVEIMRNLFDKGMDT
jgi:pilus assembly protein CpaF